MRIALDARPLCVPYGAGLTTFLRSLLCALASLDADNEYLLYAHRGFAGPLPEGRPWRTRIGGGGYGTVWMQTVVPRWLQHDAVDLFWGTQHVLPLLAPRSVKRVLTVHDLNYLRVPAAMSRTNFWINRTLVPPSLRAADAVVAVSNNTRNDILECVGLPSEKVRVIPLAADACFKPHPAEDASESLAARLGVRGPFFLTVGTPEPRKNLVTVVNAFARLGDRLPQHKLFLVGPCPRMAQSEWPGVQRRIVDRIVRLGYVDRAVLPLLYAAADAFVFPSLYEGFGLPPLEAMACGAAVVAANTSCLPEIVGDGAILVDPRDAASLASHLERLARNPGERAALGAKGLARARLFSWDATARGMLEVFTGVCGRSVRLRFTPAARR